MRRRALALLFVLAPLASAQEGVGDAKTQQEALWQRASATPYETLPALGSAGFQHTWKDTTAALSKSHMRKAFDQADDQRPVRTKTFHPFGTVAKVVFETTLGAIGRLPEGAREGTHPYTGLFKSGAAGLVRLSLADDEDPFIPGVGLKLLADGAPSANVLAIPSFAGQTGRDFFARSPTNVLPGTKGLGFMGKLTIGLFIRIQKRAVQHPLVLALDRVAAVNRDGSRVEAPRAPHQVEFRPADAHLPADGTDDFRSALAAQVPSGTVIYRVFGRDEGETEWWYLGQVRTESGFVASAFGDKELHFVHSEWFPRPKSGPQGQ